MRRQSPKQRELYEQFRDARNDFLGELGWRCAVCGAGDVAVHEMVDGPNRMRAFGRREAWLPACWPHNSEAFKDKKAWPLARQLAVKAMVDPHYFNLDVINELLGPAGTEPVIQRIVAADVLPWIITHNRRGTYEE